MVNVDNDYRKWVSFYEAIMPSGKTVVIATQQMLAPDGEKSIFFHYVFGEEWPQETISTPDGTKINLTDSVFLAHTEKR